MTPHGACGASSLRGAGRPLRAAVRSGPSLGLLRGRSIAGVVDVVASGAGFD